MAKYMVHNRIYGIRPNIRYTAVYMVRKIAVYTDTAETRKNCYGGPLSRCGGVHFNVKK